MKSVCEKIESYCGFNYTAELQGKIAKREDFSICVDGKLRKVMFRRYYTERGTSGYVIKATWKSATLYLKGE